MTTLVTGGTGFLGRWLVRDLVDRDEEVRVLSRSYDAELDEWGVELVEGSITDRDAVRRATNGVARVYHLAGRVERSTERAHLMYDVHVTGTRELLSALQNEDGLQKVVVASTSGTVGVSESEDFIANDQSPFVERIVRRWPYYLSKIYAERVCDEFVDNHELPVVQMRPSLLLGPDDRRRSSTGDVALFVEGKLPSVLPGGVSFVDVRDTADAFVSAMESAEPGEKYLLTAANMSLKDFFDELERISGVPGPSLALPPKLAEMGSRLLDSAMRAIGKSSAVSPASVQMGSHYWYVDASRAVRELDFDPRDPVETLRDTVRWIQRRQKPSNRRKTPPSEWVRPETIASTE